MTDEEWGPWVEHDGSHVPDETIDAYVGIISNRSGEEVYAEGYVSASLASHNVQCWLGGGPDGSGYNTLAIIRYRIRKPKGLSLLQQIAADVTTPIKEDA